MLSFKEYLLEEEEAFRNANPGRVKPRPVKKQPGIVDSLKKSVNKFRSPFKSTINKSTNKFNFANHFKRHANSLDFASRIKSHLNTFGQGMR